MAQDTFFDTFYTVTGSKTYLGQGNFLFVRIF